jgi:hypothetical protein
MENVTTAYAYKAQVCYISFCAYILQHSSLNLLSLHYSNKEHDCRDQRNYEEEHKQTPWFTHDFRPDAIFVFVYNHQLDYQRSGMYSDHHPVKWTLMGNYFYITCVFVLIFYISHFALIYCNTPPWICYPYVTTTLLALTVFLTIISDDLPTISDPMPSLCLFIIFGRIIFIFLVSVHLFNWRSPRIPNKV